MKRKKIAIVLALCTALLLCVAGCGQKPEVTEPPTTVPTEPSAADIYNKARAVVDAAADLKLRITAEKTTSVGGEVYSEVSDQTLHYVGLGSDSVKALLQETINYGDAYTVAYEEVCADGTVYLLMDKTYRMSAPMTPEAYLDRQVPAVLLDASLYASVEAEESSSGTTIVFSDGLAAESWAMPEGAELVEASGTAVLSAAGELRKTTYRLTYDFGSARITEAFEVYADMETGEILVPEDAADYVAVQDLDAVRLSEETCGYVFQTEAVSTATVESITCEAAAVIRNQSTQLDLYCVDEMLAKVGIDISLMDYGTGRSDSYSQEELYRNGTYTISVNGGEPTEQSGVTDSIIRDYCDSDLMSHMIAFDYWQDATVEDLGSLYLVECTFTEQMALDLCDNVCQILFEDPDFLDNYADDYTTTEITGYFAVDKYTSLPTAAGYAYAGSHTIEGQSYALTLQSDQSFHTPNQSAYKAITDQLLPETEPENQATPLLYHVTGEDGQEMWLMGTIHVGDERTAYLPQEVYDAFDASDALAVECDVQTFEKQVEEDAALQTTIAGYYYYADGTTAADHADPELLETAERYMKASGSYNANLSYMKPSIWTNSLENFYLRQAYNLVSDKGMDNRLLTLAKEQGKEILEIESSEFQIAMMTGYSDALQELMLKEILEYDPQEYWMECEEMYEKWCRGDEAELRQMLIEEADTEDLTQEELPLYEEYNKAMILDRNDGMLEVAKEYLESGKKVFYAVGLAHLLQDNGLVDTLQEAGYTVEQVVYR